MLIFIKFSYLLLERHRNVRPMSWIFFGAFYEDDWFSNDFVLHRIGDEKKSPESASFDWRITDKSLFIIHTRLLKLADGSLPNEIEVNKSNCSIASKWENVSFNSLANNIESLDRLLLTFDIALMKEISQNKRNFHWKSNLIFLACSSSSIVGWCVVGNEVELSIICRVDERNRGGSKRMNNLTKLFRKIKH